MTSKKIKAKILKYADCFAPGYDRCNYFWSLCSWEGMSCAVMFPRL